MQTFLWMINGLRYHTPSLSCGQHKLYERSQRVRMRQQQGGFLVTIAGVMLAIIMFCGWYLWDEGVFQSEEEQIAKLTSAIVPNSSVVFDRNGEKIGEYYNFYHVFIPYAQIPKTMVDALLSVEDRKFFEHKGVNWRSMGRAFLAIATSGRFRQGGSTITMQLVKNYLLTREKKVSRKLREIILSYYVEKNLSKERILELYLNTMYMGHGAYGVGAASQTYFGRPLDQLNVHEFALLAGLFQAPSAYDPHKNPDMAIKRQRVVIDTMVVSGVLPQTDAAAAKNRKLEFKPWTPLNETVAPFFLTWVRQLVSEKLGDEGETINDRGMKIYTSLDKKLQDIANTSMQHTKEQLLAIQSSLKLKKNDRVESALVAVDPTTGSVLAMNGGREFKESQFNRAVASKRSPGSAFKPVVYSLALEKNMSWADLVFVSPLNLGGYKPKNHDGEDMTEVTLIKALARSMNTPVVTLAQKFGIKNIIERAVAMGVKSDMPDEIGIAIGGFSCSMLDIARIYATIANDGVLFDTWAIQKIVDRDDKVLFDASLIPVKANQVFSREIAQMLRSGLQSVLTVGTASSVADLAPVAAGKTGTSDDSRDNWFAGFTRNTVVVTWVGTDGHAPMGKAASGSALALPQWNDFIRQTINGPRAAEPWTNSEELAFATFDPDYGTPAEHGVTALFRKDHLPKASQASEDIKTIQREKGGSYRGLKIDD